MSKAQAAWSEQRSKSAGVVRICGLNHHFGEGDFRKQVLVDNNLELPAGEIIIMTGPSGSGKTTLLTLIGALRSVQDGSVRVLGQELRGLANERLVDVRRSIGFIFQDHNLFPALTAMQNVRLAVELQALPAHARRERAAEILTRLGLGNRMHYRPAAMSGGQRQRVAIARALVNQPRLILADEPTAALDRDTGREVVNLLQELARQDNCTILLVTHDNRILDVADRIINLVDGRITSHVAVKETLAICQFLAQCPTFVTVSHAILSTVAEKMHQEFHPAGTVLIRKGDVGDKFYLIREGSVNVQVQEGQTIKVLQAGEAFGEMALLTGQPRSATVLAREDVLVYVLGKADFRAVLDTSEPFKEQILKVIFQRQ